MNYSFLITMGAFLVLVAPFLLIGAYREGKRRRKARDAKQEPER